MERFGINVEVKNQPVLEPGFLPIGLWNQAYLEMAGKPLSLALERADGQMAVVHTQICGTQKMRAADEFYVNRTVKTLLWMKGGFRLYVSGDRGMYEYLKKAYSDGGEQDFDFHYFAGIFEHPFEILYVNRVPEAKDITRRMGGHLEGCRIGFDAGGSDRKVSAVIDGESVWDEEVVWFPKTNADPEYHYQGITAALRAAAEHLPRVDAVGVSSAGVYINNRTMNASLFLAVPKDLFDAKVKDIYIRAITDTFGNVPYEVVNDGDVSALAGMLSIGEPNVLGIAMGTSEAGGFVNAEGNITGWLNELAFVPVDVQEGAVQDEWSLDHGTGAKYFSQDAVIRLAPAAGIELAPALSPAEKLKEVQKLMEAGDGRAEKIYRSIGTYLGHTLAEYYRLYGYRHALLLGRVMSGKGGDLILAEALRVLAEEYPETAAKIRPQLPDEKFRRVGQSAAAASLPEKKHP